MSADSRTILLGAIRSLLRPVVGFAIRHSIKIQDFTEATKQVYLEIAADELKRRRDEPNTSRLSVITGLHRRDVDRLTAEEGETRYGADLLSRVLGQWQGDKRFSSGGRPKILSVEGKESAFAELVNSVSKNLNAYTVLFELERSGSVKRTSKGLSLIRPSYEMSGDAAGAFRLLGLDSDDLVRAVESNVFEKREPLNLHSKTSYDNVCLDAIDQIRGWFLERGRALHEEARKFLSQFDIDLNPRLKGKKGGGRVAIGTFSITESGPETAGTEERK